MKHKDIMWQDILKQYPDAVFTIYFKSIYGEELHFYPTPEAEEEYAAAWEGGKTVIYTEY
jgi:hypothetical protein